MGWTTQGVLLPGFGRDFAQMSTYDHEDWADAVADALLPLRAAHESVMLVGNSVGAAVSLAVASRNEIDSLLLFAPFWRANQRLLDALYPAARLAFPRIRPFKNADFADPKFCEALARFLPDSDPDDLATQAAIRDLVLPTSVLGTVRAAGRAGYRAAIQVEAPTLIIQGTDDIVSHPERTRELARRLPAATELRMVAGDHVLTLLNNGAQREIIEAIQTFAMHNVQFPTKMTQETSA